MKFNEFNAKTAKSPIIQTRQLKRRVDTLQNMVTQNAENMAKKNVDKLSYKSNTQRDELEKDILKAIEKLLIGSKNKSVKIIKYNQKNL